MGFRSQYLAVCHFCFCAQIAAFAYFIIHISILIGLLLLCSAAVAVAHMFSEFSAPSSVFLTN